MTKSYAWFYEDASILSFRVKFSIGPGLPKLVIDLVEGELMGKSIGITKSKKNPIL